MKIFNLENPTKGVPATRCECIVIATWDEWSEVARAVEAYSKSNPRAKKIKAINQQLGDYLAVL